MNPYDLDQASSALAAALVMSAEEQQERMRALRGFVSEWNVTGGRAVCWSTPRACGRVNASWVEWPTAQQVRRCSWPTASRAAGP